MPLNQNVLLDNVWLKVGRRGHRMKFTDGMQPGLIGAREYGLLLHWPKSLSFLTLTVEYGDKKPFSRGRPAFEAVAREVGARAPDPFFLEGQSVVVARVARADPVVLTVAVDTDDVLFLKAVKDEQDRGNARELRIPIGVMAFAGSDSEEGRIQLILAPVQPVPAYPGYVALDVGNTASTLVCLPKGFSQARTAAIQVLDANEDRNGLFRASADPVVSHVRIEEAEKFNEFPTSAKWVVGRMAATVVDGLVAGPKRLAAARDWEREQVFNARSHTSLPRRVPGELLVCRLLQRFREAQFKYPERLALTYPTTYEPRELEQLREVVYRGFQRAAWRKQDRARDEESLKGTVPVLLDEASAAAYFFLYRRILEAPGGLPRFRYLHPDGLNLLLYDCGGGTTDVALVSAASEPGSNRLQVRVRARSGIRGFGGDNITVAVFRILKAKMAVELEKLSPPKGERKPGFPEKEVSGDELEKYLRSRVADFSQLVPTTFQPDVMDDVNREARKFALELWQRAETIKRDLQDRPSADLGIITPQAGKGVSLWDRLLERFRANAGQEKAAREKLQQVKVHRWEVDALVSGPINRSIDNCNQLIREKLTDAGEEVHWVVASGNAARYPLIQDLLKKRLAVQFLDEDRFFMDPDNLKHSVAKGAVLYLAILDSDKQLDVEFDAVPLHQRLPFDVAYRDPVTNACEVMFHENHSHEEIANQPYLLKSMAPGDAAPARRVTSHTINLARRWPGDGEGPRDSSAFSPYLRFQFDDDIEFPVEVTFNPQEKCFEARDSRGAQGVVVEETDDRAYESPVQKGDL